ncbi:lectin-like protein LEC [Cicer arietinum]|uniref:L-type lectin-domain containing receptor kinase VIII.2-like n=1 Tax=Cicer arietinum TaxID=3827 RepID=A0A1S2YLV8_CICAR|nr:L-type lectin-domain containing receptor kinase VIII.2-like [Cicer arietinum]
MASFTTTHYFKTLIVIILFIKTQSFDPIPLFSFADFEKDLKFKSNVALFGDAKVVNGESKIQFYGSSTEIGRVIYKKPIQLFQGKPNQLVSFSTYFTFSIPFENGGGLDFVMIPKHRVESVKGDVFNQSSSGFSLGLKNEDFDVINVEFDASRDSNKNEILISSKVGSSVFAKRSSTYFTNLGLKSDEKLHAWIDYEASSRRLEVRLSKHGNSKPSDPLLWHKIDITNVLKAKEMFIGFSPSNVKGKSNVFLYSWSFVMRRFPTHSMHSDPLDPKVFVKNSETATTIEQKEKAKKNDCVLRILAAMIFGTGCGALTAFTVLYLWTIFGNKRAVVVVPEGCVMQPLDVEYKKVKIVVDNNKTIGDGNK